MTHPEDRAANAERSQFLDEEAAYQRHCEACDEYAENLLRTSEFNPWTREHFAEAIENAPDSDQRVAHAGIVAAIVDLGLGNEHTNHFALTALKKLVENYWLAIAQVEAKRRITRRV
jgi:hypothetical protein